MKKFLAIVLIAVIMMAMGTVAFAESVEPATTYTITITRDPSYASTATGNETYTYWKILDASIGTAGTVDPNTGVADPVGKAAYSVDSEAKATALTGTGVFTATASADGSVWNITAVEGKTAADITAALDTMDKTLFTPTATVTRDGASDVVISGLAPGYYFIDSSLGSALAVQTLNNVTIKEKNTYPTIDKKQGDENKTYADAAIYAGVGDVINYQIVVTVPATADKDIKVTDTLCAGLTSNNDVAVDTGVANTDYTINGLVVTLKPTQANLGKTVTITFSATVNSSAITMADTAKKNDVKLEYSNYVQEDSVNFKLKAAAAYKFDGDTEKALQGVEFTLKENGTEFKVTKSGDYYYPDAAGSATVVTDANGMIVVRGLDDGKTYTLTETKALDGYNLLTGDKTFTLVDDDSTYAPEKDDNEVVQIENHQGAELPSTGGIGTTIFYIVGSILVLGAAVVLITRRRMDQE